MLTWTSVAPILTENQSRQHSRAHLEAIPNKSGKEERAHAMLSRNMYVCMSLYVLHLFICSVEMLVMWTVHHFSFLIRSLRSPPPASSVNSIRISLKINMKAEDQAKMNIFHRNYSNECGTEKRWRERKVRLRWRKGGPSCNSNPSIIIESTSVYAHSLNLEFVFFSSAVLSFPRRERWKWKGKKTLPLFLAAGFQQTINEMKQNGGIVKAVEWISSRWDQQWVILSPWLASRTRHRFSWQAARQ